MPLRPSVSLILLVCLAACGGDNAAPHFDDGGDDAGGTGSDAGDSGVGGDGGGIASCGDGIREGNELCDDSNTRDGDYCSADCRAITGRCGDGVIQNVETCDPGSDSPVGCQRCFTTVNYRCEGEPSICGPRTLDWDKPLSDYSRTDAETYCAWLIATTFGSLTSISCPGGITLTPVSVSDCADRFVSFASTCVAPILHVLECSTGATACEINIAGPTERAVAACERETCRHVCEPNSWTCNANVARQCNQWGNDYEDTDCGSGTCSTAYPDAVHANEVCGLAICTPNRWSCADNTAQLCAPDGLAYAQQMVCGQATCISGGTITTPVEMICDTDECASGTDDCGSNAACTNTAGSFTCACNSGYAGDGRNCSDVDECGLPAATCDTDPTASCTNSVGGFSCGCPAGFTGDGVGDTGCIDIDECAMGVADCSVHARCANDVGSYTCTCIADYMGDGITCSPVPHLTSLVPTVGVLSPGFQSNVTQYRMRLPPSVDVVQLTATSYDGSPITIEGAVVASAATSDPIALSSVTQVVSAVFAGRTYSISVERGGTTFLKASNMQAGDQFGVAVAIESNWLVVGAPFEDSSATTVNGNQQDEGSPDSGAAYVFEYVSSAWVQRAYLKASPATPGAQFGSSVTINGSRIVVGAPHDNSTTADDSGAAYVFTRSGSQWYGAGTLPSAGLRTGDRFGVDVSIFGNLVAVGADGDDNAATGVNPIATNADAPDSGAAYVFSDASGSWQRRAYVKGSNADAGDLFGRSVGVSATTLIIGAPREDSASQSTPDDNSCADSGAIYFVEGLAGTSTMMSYRKDLYIDAGDMFGSAVAIAGTRAVAGGTDSVMPLATIGNVSGWTYQGLWPHPGGVGELQEVDVATNGTDHVVGTPGAPDGTARGFAWGRTWSGAGIAKIGSPYYAYDGQRFGASLGVNSTVWAVGAPGDASDQSALGNGYVDSGAVYVF